MLRTVIVMTSLGAGGGWMPDKADTEGGVEFTFTLINQILAKTGPYKEVPRY